MSYITRLDPLVFRQLVRWGLSDSVRVEAHLRSTTGCLDRPPLFWSGIRLCSRERE